MERNIHSAFWNGEGRQKHEQPHKPVQMALPMSLCVLCSVLLALINPRTPGVGVGGALTLVIVVVAMGLLTVRLNEYI